MFFPLIFPQFIDFNSNYVVQFSILITTYIVLDFLSLIGYALLAQKLINWIKTNPKTINTISASVLVLIALIIIITQQYWCKWSYLLSLANDEFSLLNQLLIN